MQSAQFTTKPGEPQATLGLGFWAFWLIGMLAVSAAFSATMWWLQPRMESLSGLAMGGLAVLVFTGALIGLAQIPYRIRQKRGLEGRMREPYRRYALRFLPAMIGYVILLLLAVWYAKQAQPTGLIALAIAVAPALPLLLAIRASKYFRATKGKAGCESGCGSCPSNQPVTAAAPKLLQLGSSNRCRE